MTPSRRGCSISTRTPNRTQHYWQTFVPGVTAGQLYGCRVSGPFDPIRGLLFDANKVLLDAYGNRIARPAGRSREAARTREQHGDSADALSLCQVLVQAACPIGLMVGDLAAVEEFVSELIELSVRHDWHFWHAFGLCRSAVPRVFCCSPVNVVPARFAC
jgi:hypothetical protein